MGLSSKNVRSAIRTLADRRRAAVSRAVGLGSRWRPSPLRFALGALTLPIAVFFLHRPPLLQPYAFSRAVFDRNGQLLRMTLSADQRYRLFTPLHSIAPSLREAILLQEDRYFLDHPGVNPFSMARAAWHNTFGEGSRVGGSTISMQLARLRFGLNTRTLTGKAIQMLRAMQLELHYSKEELLEAYVNLAPYGYNIEGLAAASFIYFQKEPSQLTLPEALTLAVIPQSPARRRLGRSLAAEQEQLRAPRLRLFQRWKAAHPEDAPQETLVALPIDSHAKTELPFAAPHTTTALLRSSPESEIHTTLDAEVQHLLERGVRQFVREKREIGIDNAAVMLIDWRTMEVVASIGSAKFHDARIHGQVDGTRMRRSPGSTLKPFVYALAYDQGLIHPLSLLRDAPTGFGDYEPENFDREFLGPVSARDALRLSRNIPAIALASNVRHPSLYEFLGNGGIGQLKPESHYGLSLILGGAEVTMRELAQLYSLLAAGGEFRPLQELRATGNAPPPARRLLTPEASFLTLDALRDTVRPEIRAGGPEVFWKTGTSNGFHDAWTAGVFGRYTLVVWVGSFDGSQNPAFVGIRSAAPLFFQLVHAIRTVRPVNDDIDAQIPRLHLQRVKVCAPSGDPFDDACPAATSTWFIPGISPIAKQHVFRRVMVNVESGNQICSDGVPNVEWRTAEYWPTDLRETFEKAGIHKPLPPPPDPACAGETLSAGPGPKILSPLSAVEYHAAPNEKPEQAIPLRASADGDVAALFWFSGARFIGRAAPGETILWQPQPGRYHLRVVDDRGRSSARTVTVAPDPHPAASAAEERASYSPPSRS